VGVVGFDIAGAEAGFPPTRHLDAFEYLQRENFHFTIHAGEGFGLPSIWQALQWCGADRLGHGVRIVDDISEVWGEAVASTTTPDERRRGYSQFAGARLGRLAAYVRDKRRRVHRRPPDRAAAGPALPGHGPTDNRLMSGTSMSARWRCWWTRSVTAGLTCRGSPSTR
jgi:adenosine deaminase